MALETSLQNGQDFAVGYLSLSNLAILREAANRNPEHRDETKARSNSTDSFRQHADGPDARKF